MAEPRSGVDVVVPFLGSAASLEGLVDRLARLRLGSGDSVTIADNRPAEAEPVSGRNGVAVIRAPERRSSYHARNVGAANGGADWLLFIDGDVDPSPDLIDRYLAAPPAEGTGILVGAVSDEPAGAGAPAVARYTELAASMDQANTLELGEWGYAQTANCAVRRAAFAQVGGFRAEIRSGGDADLCFRVKAAGWAMEARPQAAVVHRSRTTLRKLLRQRARHGAGAAWLAKRYPGSFPRRRWPGLAAWAVTSLGHAGFDAARGRRDDALVHAIEPLSVWAQEIGRLLPNESRR
jgi:glycosyltransferase involved in cell wall biosynthesis